ncbi:vomeronasal type-2 receptor 26 [Xenopus laevis]|uniref:Vomeronasal type-2 receptor 26 n=1 Tax=Xenopus laevis TaxID=8355 RepID=A0A8J0TMD4_XENLA|nr:vomeronasal type-2 receptor 26 [Xenopus laevis]
MLCSFTKIVTFIVAVVLLTLLLFVEVISARKGKSMIKAQPCEIKRKFHESHTRYSLDGDIIIGGILNIFLLNTHYILGVSNYPYNILPDFPGCFLPSIDYMRHTLAFIYAIEEINSNEKILPNISLGYVMYDACSNEVIALDRIFRIMSEINEAIPNYNCDKIHKPVAVIGHSLSSTTYTIAQITQLYGYSQLSYGAMDPVFNDHSQFPLVFRTVPNEYLQFEVIVQLLIHFKWTWVGIISSDDISNHKASLELIKKLKNHRICVENHIVIAVSPHVYINPIVKLIQQLTAKVIILYCTLLHIMSLTRFLNRSVLQITGKVFVASVTFNVNDDNSFMQSDITLNGSLFISVHKGEIPGFMNYLSHRVWETMPDKNFVGNFKMLLKYFPSLCNDSQSTCLFFKYWGNTYYTTSVIYNTVHILAQALHQMYLDKVLFENGSKDLAEESKYKTPISLCNDICPTGYRKSLEKGKFPCCYDCIRCSEGEIASSPDADNCLQCPEDHWSNPNRDFCLRKAVDFLSYGNCLGIVLATAALLFSVCTGAVLWIFIKNRSCQIAKANNRNLSYILLVSLFLSFCCSFLFIGRPVPITCILRQPTFLFLYTVAISSLLGKTLTVVIAFNATKPGTRLRKLVGSSFSVSLVLFCSLGKILICSTWIIWATPFVALDTKTTQQTMTLWCNEGSFAAFCVSVAYIAVLALISFIVAFMARKLPDRYNEAQHITFSMLVFFSVWVSFIPTYLSTKGKSMLKAQNCEIKRNFNAFHTRYSLDGDIIIGGIMNVFLLNTIYFIADISHSHFYRIPPYFPGCFQPSIDYMRHTLAFIYAIEEINSNDKILPNISLGYIMYDACSNEVIALDRIFRILSEINEAIPNYSCQKSHKPVAIIGHSLSSTTNIIAQITQLYGYSQV